MPETQERPAPCPAAERWYIKFMTPKYPWVQPHYGCSDDGIVVEGPPSLNRRNTFLSMTCRRCGETVERVPQDPYRGSMCHFGCPECRDA